MGRAVLVEGREHCDKPLGEQLADERIGEDGFTAEPAAAASRQTASSYTHTASVVPTTTAAIAV